MAIYLDSAASTPVDPDVFRAAQPFFMEQYGNPSSVHSMGRKAREAVEKARKQVADCLGCNTLQIFFCGSATEADNWAIQMMCKYLDDTRNSQKTLLYLPIEHKAILKCLPEYALPLWVNASGVATLDIDIKVINELPDTPIAISCMWICNEIGSIQPIKELSDFCYIHKIPLHVDATQAVGRIPINLKDYPGITTLAFSGHKINSLKGCGVLVIRDPDADYVRPFIHGGGQEKGLRAGTENVPAIVGLGVAMEKIANKSFDNTHVQEMHDFLINALSEIECVRFNGEGEHHSPYYLSASFKGVLNEALVLSLDRRGICVSSGSACNTGSLEPSHVLTAIGCDSVYINGTIRISLSDQNTLEECKVVAEAIKEDVAKLRSVSPTWKGE